MDGIGVKIKPEVGINWFPYMIMVSLELDEMCGLPENQSLLCNVVSFTNTARPLIQDTVCVRYYSS